MIGVGSDVHDAAASSMRFRAAEDVHVDRLAGDRLHDFRAGDKDAALGAEDHQICQRGTVGGATGRRAEDDGDLRDLPRGSGHRGEDSADGVEAQHPFAQTRTTGMPDSHDRHRVGEGSVVRGDDGAATVVAHRPTLNRGVGCERDAGGARHPADGDEHSSVIRGSDEFELTVVDEHAEANRG